MRDQDARVEIEVLKTEIRELKRRLEILESRDRSDNGTVYHLKDLEVQFKTLVKELGFSFDDGVFERDIKDPNSSLFRIQLQIAALISALELEESYKDGRLIYRNARSK